MSKLIDKLKVPEFDRELIRKYLEAKGCVRDASFINGEQAALYQHSLLTKEIALRNRVIEKLIQQRDGFLTVLAFGKFPEAIDRYNEELSEIMQAKE